MNKYRQAPVDRAPEPEKPWQPSEKCAVSVGDAATCSLRPLFFTIPSPCIVHEVEADKHYTSGWKVMVLDDNGVEHWIDSWYFKKHNPA